MEYRLTDEQRKTLELVREFGAKYFLPDEINRWEKEQGVPDDVVRAFANLDFGPASLVTNRAKRDDLLFTIALIVEELSRLAGTMLPFQLDLHNLWTLSELATGSLLDMVKREYERTGRLVFSIAVTEPGAGSDLRNMTTTVKRIGDKFVLNGRKTFVCNGEFTPFILVAAVDEEASEGQKYPAVTLWLVPYDLEGVRTFPIEKRAQRMLPFSDILFEDVELSSEHFVAGGKDGFRQLLRFFEAGRCITCASSLGMAQAAMEDAVKRAGSRIAFGVPIARLQQIEQMITDMEVKIINMRNLVYRAARSRDENRESSRLDIALMKRYVPRASVEVASDAMQIFGGTGYTENARVFRIWENCRGNQIAEGTDEIMVHVAAPMLVRKYADE